MSYVYDDLYRLTAADYVDGTFFHYTYDEVGNRLTQDSLAGMIIYDYDDAHRLTSVDGVTYTWDDNGNLLSDGVSTYTYTYDNMLASVNKGGIVYEYLYSGLGDRLEQTVDGVPTQYTLDIVSGLTQVISDGTNAYLYGRERIGEEGANGWQYPLGDALSSVRQLTDSEGNVGLVKAYEPYGSVLSSTGDAVSNYGFTGEWTDDYIMLLYLRSRYMSPSVGRFTQKDPSGLEDNLYLYAEANPIINVDPSGLFYSRYYATRFAEEWDQDGSNSDKFMTADDVFGYAASRIVRIYYKDYGIAVDINDVFLWKWAPVNMPSDWTDCANFASHVLYQGGIRDSRSDPNTRDPIQTLKDNQVNQFWNPKLMLGEGLFNVSMAERSPWKLTEELHPFAPWVQAPQLATFLEKKGVSIEYSGSIPQYKDGGLVKGGSYQGWDYFLERNSNLIQPGDIVFYSKNGANWTHVAIVMGWGEQTFYGDTGSQNTYAPYSVLPDEYWENNCGSIWKPRVVDRAGNIQYNGSRSIDNTSGHIDKIKIVHLY